MHLLRQLALFLSLVGAGYTQTAPMITAQPSGRTANAGDAATFSVTASGTTVTYQWFRNGIALAGATAATLDLTDVQVTDAGAYHVTVSNSAGGVTSAPAILRGTASPPTITAQPVSRVATAGEAVTFLVVAPSPVTGALQYQWRRNGFPLSGATTATLTFSPASRSDIDTYDVRVNDGLSVAYSDPVELHVVPTTLPQVLRIDPGFNVSIDGDVFAMAQVAGGKIVVAGAFGRVNGVARSSIARLNTDGTLDEAFTASASNISSLAVQGDGRLLIAGEFTRVNDTARAGVARLNADGTLDPTFNLNATFNNAITIVRALSGGRMLIGGGFTNIGGVGRSRIARLHADGSLDPSFVPFFGEPLITFFLTDLAALPDERVLYATDGSISSNGIRRPGVGRLARDGATDPAFSSGGSPSLGVGVYDLAPLPGGRVLVGGSFSEFNGIPRSRIALLEPNGAVDPVFVPATPSVELVANLVPTRDGAVYVSRRSTTSSVLSAAAALTRLNSSGAADESLAVAFSVARTPPNPGFAFDTRPEFSAIHLLDDGNLLLATGTFREGNVTRTGLVRTLSASGAFILSQPAAIILSAGANLSLSVTASGAASFTYQWFKDGAAIAGASRSTYAVSVVQASAGGTYFVRLTHSGGTLDSAPAVVTIEESAPVFAGATRAPAGLGATLQAGTRYALTAPALQAGSTPLTYQWSKDDIALPGETGTALFRAAWSVTDSGAYRVVVSNSRGSITSQPVLQTVAATPDWTWATPLPQGNSLSLVSYVNGTFFASGQRGTLLRSINGLDWSALRIAGSAAVGPIAFGNGRHVALTSFGGLLTSADGTTWTPRESGLTDGRSLGRIVFGGGRFVAVGSLGTVLTSVDGLAWSAISLPTTDAATGVAFGAGQWLVLTSGGRVFTSTDGVAWSVRPDLPENTAHLAYGAGLFATAVLNASAIYTSPDGQVWTRRLSNASTSVTVLDLHFADGGFLAALATSAGRYLTSADGITWREITPASSLNTASFTLTRGGNTYVMAAAAPDLLRWSVDGVFWSGIGRAEGRSFRAIATNGTVAVAVGTAQPPVGRALSSLLNISYDGVRWSERSSGAGGTLNDIAYGGAPANLFVAVGGGGGGNVYITSPNGVNWTSRGFGTSQTIRGVKHVNGRFLAVGDNTMLASTDGTAWIPVPLAGSPSLYQTAYGAGAYVAVGAAGTVLRSTDAVVWTTRASGATGTLVDVIFAAGKFAAVSSTGEIVTSLDGLAWSSKTSNATALANIVYAGGQFLALGARNSYFVSTDTEIWTPEQHGSGQSLFDALEFKNRLVAVGAFGSVLTQALPAPAGTAAPVITASPASQTARTGQSLTLTVASSGSPAPAYQWLKNDVPIAGATAATLVLSPVQFADAGTYACVATTPAGAAISATATLLVAPAAQLSNLSVRTTLAAAQSLNVGLTVGGNGNSKRILVRAAGPALASFGVPGVMADPKIELFSRGQKFAENDNWNTDSAGFDFARVGAFVFPNSSRDAAWSGFLDGGVSVVASGTGAGALLVECYDIDLATPTPNRLINLSARNRVGPGADVLIAGLYVAGSGTLRVLVRGVGPALTAFGVGGVLADPKVELFDSAGVKIAENDNWSDAFAPTFASVGAFALPSGSLDAALVATLTAGRAYTVQVSGANGGVGEALVELYELP